MPNDRLLRLMCRSFKCQRSRNAFREREGVKGIDASRAERYFQPTALAIDVALTARPAPLGPALLDLVQLEIDLRLDAVKPAPDVHADDQDLDDRKGLGLVPRCAEHRAAHECHLFDRTGLGNVPVDIEHCEALSLSLRV